MTRTGAASGHQGPLLRSVQYSNSYPSAEAGQEILDKTRREAEQLREKRLAELEQEKKKAIAEIRAEVVKFSMLLTARMIEKTIDRATADKLADDVMRDMGGLPS